MAGGDGRVFLVLDEKNNHPSGKLTVCIPHCITMPLLKALRAVNADDVSLGRDLMTTWIRCGDAEFVVTMQQPDSWPNPRSLLSRSSRYRLRSGAERWWQHLHGLVNGEKVHAGDTKQPHVFRVHLSVDPVAKSLHYCAKGSRGYLKAEPLPGSQTTPLNIQCRSTVFKHLLAEIKTWDPESIEITLMDRTAPMVLRLIPKIGSKNKSRLSLISRLIDAAAAPIGKRE